jgi:glycosyltransferase involved in cell wall biosynthesis
MATESTHAGRRALLVCLTHLKTDPRVMRQVEWLASEGWTVDTAGLGPLPDPRVASHTELLDEPGWSRPRIIRGFILLLFPSILRFLTLVGSRMPRAVKQRVAALDYDLVVINDLDYVPWATRVRASRPVHFHLDLHEYYTPDLPDGTSLRWLMTGYNTWLRRQISSPRFLTRSTVAEGIADIYHSEFGIPKPPVVRNCPDFVQAEPSPVDPDRIELLYHGNAAWERGLRPLVDAVPLLEERFSLRLMLTGDPAVRDELVSLTAGLGDRVRFTSAVPMNLVATSINSSDLEVMLYPPLTPNLRYALPNKLFEAVQGRLGLVVGESPSMTDVIDEFGNGAVVAGWDAAALAATVNALSAADIERLKLASSVCASQLNSGVEKAAFFRSIELT